MVSESVVLPYALFGMTILAMPRAAPATRLRLLINGYFDVIV